MWSHNQNAPKQARSKLFDKIRISFDAFLNNELAPRIIQETQLFHESIRQALILGQLRQHPGEFVSPLRLISAWICWRRPAASSTGSLRPCPFRIGEAVLDRCVIKGELVRAACAAKDLRDTAARPR